MEDSLYKLMAMYEDKHWWFVARRRIIDALLSRLNLPKPASILEVGCGTGGNLSLLSKYGTVRAVEANDFARHKAEERHVAVSVQAAHLPDAMPKMDERFDLITMFDVLEHIDEDPETLTLLRGYLKPEGKLCLTVPAMPFLWSGHDVANHHKRRYTKQSLTKVVTNAGYKPSYISYFNIWLFPVVAATRVISRALGIRQDKSDLSMPAPWLNNLLERLFASERNWIGKTQMPFGVSLIMSANRA